MFGVSTPRLFLLKVNNSNDPNSITAGVEGLATSMPQGFPAFRLSSRSRATDFQRSLRVVGRPRDRARRESVKPLSVKNSNRDFSWKIEPFAWGGGIHPCAPS